MATVILPKTGISSVDTSMKIKDRIRELRRVKASDILPHPRNWRKHPTAQLDALKGVLDEVGWADALLVRETPEGLQLIDGHARTEVAPDAEVPVLVLDVSEEEAEKILATHDPLAQMAEANQDILDELLDDISTGSEALQEMLEGLRYNDPMKTLFHGLKSTPGGPKPTFLRETISPPP